MVLIDAPWVWLPNLLHGGERWLMVMSHWNIYSAQRLSQGTQAHCSAVMSANEAHFWQQGGKFHRYVLPLPVQTVFLLNKYNNVTAYKKPCSPLPAGSRDVAQEQPLQLNTHIYTHVTYIYTHADWHTCTLTHTHWSIVLGTCRRSLAMPMGMAIRHRLTCENCTSWQCSKRCSDNRFWVFTNIAEVLKMAFFQSTCVSWAVCRRMHSTMFSECVCCTTHNWSLGSIY